MNKIKSLKLNKIRINKHFKAYLKELYATDILLLGQFHKNAPTTAGVASYVTHKDLCNVLQVHKDTFRLYKIKFTGICNGDIIASSFIGYCCLVSDYMLAFFVVPKYRVFNKEIFDLIESKFDTPSIKASLYQHNTRACKFLEKRGYTLMATVKEQNNKTGVVYEKPNN